MKRRKRITRKETREQLEQLNLAGELVKLIRHFFPDLLPLLKRLPDPRHQSYITYSGVLLLMTRILSSIFYINSMRKTSEEFNSDIIIENINILCENNTEITELSYWETINRYLKKIDPKELQDILCQLCTRLIRSRAFEIIKKLCEMKQVDLIDGRVCKDHIHMYVAIPPKMSVSEFMSYLKGKSTLMLFDRHSEYRTKWGDRHFWARGYYVSTVGNVNEETILKYIQEQEENDKLEDGRK